MSFTFRSGNVVDLDHVPAYLADSQVTRYTGSSAGHVVNLPTYPAGAGWTTGPLQSVINDGTGAATVIVMDTINAVQVGPTLAIGEAALFWWESGQPKWYVISDVVASGGGGGQPFGYVESVDADIVMTTAQSCARIWFDTATGRTVTLPALDATLLGMVVQVVNRQGAGNGTITVQGAAGQFVQGAATVTSNTVKEFVAHKNTTGVFFWIRS